MRKSFVAAAIGRQRSCGLGEVVLNLTYLTSAAARDPPHLHAYYSGPASPLARRHIQAACLEKYLVNIQPCSALVSDVRMPQEE